MVEDFWRFVQVGAIPAAFASYDARVIKAVGLGDFAGMLAAQTPNIERTRLNPLIADRVAGGLLVIRRGSPPDRSQVALLVLPRPSRRPTTHRLRQFASAALQASAQGAAQRSIDASTAEPSTRAVAAGDAAISKYRLAALTALESDKDKAAAAKSSREKTSALRSRQKQRRLREAPQSAGATGATGPFSP